MPRLCRLDDLACGEARGFATREDLTYPLFVVRRGAAAVVYRDQCPHEGGPMAWKKDAFLDMDGRRIVCWAHGAQFDIDSGLCVHGPCVGQTLIRQAHTLDAQGWIVV